MLKVYSRKEEFHKLINVKFMKYEINKMNLEDRKSLLFDLKELDKKNFEKVGKYPLAGDLGELQTAVYIEERFGIPTRLTSSNHPEYDVVDIYGIRYNVKSKGSDNKSNPLEIQKTKTFQYLNDDDRILYFDYFYHIDEGLVFNLSIKDFKRLENEVLINRNKSKEDTTCRKNDTHFIYESPYNFKRIVDSVIYSKNILEDEW